VAADKVGIGVSNILNPNSLLQMIYSDLDSFIMINKSLLLPLM